ncbi:hypothetical protein Y032_0005g2494 [Ancylostoma ceylanicum]|uniref:Uncharacterized protein n=1 Tax=Ancylostoma ceylanicum TaxID=53326 RepID=A0A016VT08_9BILA|nr:hypothetical protein Y032_0005g2494 [Ancylostoma ceylanicum]
MGLQLRKEFCFQSSVIAGNGTEDCYESPGLSEQHLRFVRLLPIAHMMTANNEGCHIGCVSAGIVRYGRVVLSARRTDSKKEPSKYKSPW